MQKQKLAIFLILAISPLVLIVNSLTDRSPIIGIVASSVFFATASWALGKLLFSHESKFFKVTFGFVTILVFLALVGNVLIVLAHFTETVSLVAITVMSVTIGLSFARFGNTGSPSVAEPKVDRGKKVILEAVLLVGAFLFSVAAAFQLLWFARTGEGETSVWLTISDLFIPLVVFISFFLVVFLVFARVSKGVKLGVVCVFSFLVHSLFLLVWYPGRYGDPWKILGEARFIDRTGIPYAYSWMINQFFVVDLTVRVQEALTVFFGRLFSVDLYWVHVLLVPLLWSILTPLIAYRIVEMLVVKKSRVLPFLAAAATLLFPSLIMWGTVSVPNSVGFIFFFVSVAFLLSWLNQGGKQMWFLSLLASAVALLAHPQAGLFAFMLFFWATVIGKTKRKIWMLLSYVPLFLGYPLALIASKASFSFGNFFVLDSFLSFQSEISTILLVFGVVGLVLGVRSRFVSVRNALLLFVLYLTILSEYYLTKFGMVNVPFGAARILTMADFLLVPFVALGLFLMARAFGRTLPLKSMDASLANPTSKRFRIHLSRRFVGLFLVCLFLCLQITVALYESYPRSEILKVQPADYEVEAVRFIDSDASGRYVVLCEPTFAGVAIGFLGIDYGWLGGVRGVFGMTDWSYPTVRMYLDMTKNPSVGYMQEAMDFANAKVSYFVVSVRNTDFNKIVQRTLDILPVHWVFGGGKLYVFKYPIPVHEEVGPAVKVTFDNGASANYINTSLSYMTKNEVNSTVTLSGYSSYNVTDFPSHWTFLDLSVNGELRKFDNSSDIDSFIYVSGLQAADVLAVKWLFNSNYARVGWKEDSFKDSVWHTHERYRGTMVPNITNDGNILSLSYFFTPGSYWYYYYATSVNIATNNYPFLLMRWRSDMPVAVAAVYFELGGVQETVQLGSMSPQWSTIVVPLRSDAVVTTIMVGLSNARNKQLAGMGTLEVDYIMLASGSTP